MRERSILAITFWQLAYSKDDDIATELRTKISEFLFSMKLQDTPSEGLDREKRLIPDAGFGAKNAILGYVFGVS